MTDSNKMRHQTISDKITKPSGLPTRMIAIRMKIISPSAVDLLQNELFKI